MSAPALPCDDWSLRWAALARAAGIASDEPLLLALSGGADSVLLAHWLAAARPAVPVLAVHVDHGLRGAESDEDARFVSELCRGIGLPLASVRLQLDPRGSNLEARARAARYGELVREARASGHRTILTGHHSDDALETCLMRWARGTDLDGLQGPRAELFWQAESAEAVRLVRPLRTLRRAEVRSLLAARGLAWRSDSSNRDPRFTRTRVRHGLLPLLLDLGGASALEELRAFAGALEELERELARATAHLRWHESPHAAAVRPRAARPLGGVLSRDSLAPFAPPLVRRVLWRLLTEGTGCAPSRAGLERVLADLHAGRPARHVLARGWTLLLRARELVLVPPPRTELLVPSDPLGLAPRLRLDVPGSVTLGDGRRISAELRKVVPGSPVPRGACEVELDACLLDAGPLDVRPPLPGDRFRPLGGPGSRPLVRFLADRGVAREERGRIPLVTRPRPTIEGTVGGPDELLWVAGIAPCEEHRVRARTEWRLCLALHA